MKVRIIKIKVDTRVASNDRRYRYVYQVQKAECVILGLFWERWSPAGISAYSEEEALRLLQVRANSLATQSQVVYKGFIWDDGTLHEDMSDHV